jgi:hypothetical protein
LQSWEPTIHLSGTPTRHHKTICCCFDATCIKVGQKTIWNFFSYVLYWEAHCLTLLNSVINLLPMYAMCTLKVPITIFVHFKKSGRQSLWVDKEDKIQGKCLASWELICRPKEQGRIGVLDLRTQNNSLLMKKFVQILQPSGYPLGESYMVNILKQWSNSSHI